MHGTTDVRTRLSRDFARYLSKTDAVRTGRFKLKSGAISEIFFDFGNICRGDELCELGMYYADAIVDRGLSTVDAIFGPAYKGIPIAVAAATALWNKHKIAMPVAFNRKTAKDHGEGGKFIGFDLRKTRSIVVVDDVITDGQTKYEALEMLRAFPNVNIRAMLVGLDRQDVDRDGVPWIRRFSLDTGIPVYAITTRSEVLANR